MLAHFLLIGLVLLGARRALSRAAEPLPELLVTVPASASPRAVELAVDEEILVDLALRSGWAEREPVVRDRLARNMRFAGQEASDDGEELLARAAELGMDRSDPVARRYLSTLARRALGAAPGEAAPSDEELLAHARAHRGRYTRPSAVRFSQIFVSAERHGAQLEGVAARLGARLARGAVAPAAAAELGDPSLLPAHPAALDARRIDARFGGGFGAQVLLAPVGRWSGPLRSSFGLHFVWVHERRGAELPELDDMRAILAQDLRRERREERVRRALKELRSRYRLRLERTP